MASTDIDGTKLMILGEGATVALVIGERTYTGTLSLRTDGFKENWYIKLTNTEPGENTEVQIHKIDKPASTTGEIVKALDEIHEVTKPKDGF